MINWEDKINWSVLCSTIRSLTSNLKALVQMPVGLDDHGAVTNCLSLDLGATALPLSLKTLSVQNKVFTCNFKINSKTQPPTHVSCKIDQNV